MRTKKMIAVLCTVVLLLGGCTEKNNSYTPIKVVPSENDDTWDLVESGTAVLENDKVYLELNAETTHFTIKNKKTGNTYSSVPDITSEIMSDEISARIMSEITVEYCAEQTSELYMYSDTDSVKNNSFTVKSNNEAIRVYYSMGEVNQLLPALFTEEVFNEVLNRFTNSALGRRLERSYILYSSEEKPDDFAEKLEQYPVLADRPLYILSDVLSDADKADISADLADIGFTEEEYTVMLKSLELEDIDIQADAGFLIPLEYRLTNDGFTVSVLSDRIEEKSKDYKIHSVDLLEYFSAFTESIDGAFIIPDGSGAVIDLKDKSNLEFSKPFYGEDIAISQSLTSDDGRTLTLPVYGMKTGESGFFAIIEEAAETAELKAYSSGDVSPFNRIYSSFVLRSIDTSNNFDDAGISQYNLFASERIADSPQVRYCLLDAGKNSYTDMASLYRDYLLNTKGLTVQPQTEAPVYLDYLCMITEDASMLGIPYTKKTVLSTVSEIIFSVEQLQKEGIRGINVRLLGYGSSGLNNSVYNKFDIDNKVGTVDELKKLSEILRESGGQLYLDADMQFVYHTKNGFKPSRDAARQINRKLAGSGEIDFVTGELLSSKNKRYLVSSARFSDYASGFLKSLKKSFGDETLPGLSYGSCGLYLGGDYSLQRCIDRTESRKLLTTALDNAKDNVSMLFDYGNAYVFPYASGLLNVPLDNSQLLTEEEAIPFFQLVVSGSIPYAGGAGNMAKTGQKDYLRSIEYGAAPYAVFITRDDALLNYTEWQTELFSLSDNTHLEAFVQRVKDTDEIRRITLNKKMINHRKLSDTLFCTTYEGGYEVYVNYSDAAVEVNGVKISEKSFAAFS